MAPGGRVVVLGSYPSSISLEGIGREASVVFSSVYRDDREFAGALRLLARGLIDVAALTTSVMPLTSYGEAFASLRDPERAVKIFLDQGGGERRAEPRLAVHSFDRYSSGSALAGHPAGSGARALNCQVACS